MSGYQSRGREMPQYRVEIMAAGSVVSSTMVMAQLPFKAAETHIGQPITFRRQENDWLRVTEIEGEKRTFAYVRR
ncbi:hypothetical protein [Mesorhizobium sp. M8A.F.Ca.ET.021.01.1.1]|uniref:hypothetical protein n=1 Tax=Mesorhizobium sp. M8A.F.Ca.ET.021.01.1.1 TaxID=2496757 RepID=UPI000FD4EE64|nr:hypothetical protein [Mesorhizobium sp. M8A.F.Ca.ET.021.01.1.1]RUW53788.1 hypothetical protein EOA36_10095 [Mesorhizobium sp. M8A.F.Ca.ET.021.01.1.1]